MSTAVGRQAHSRSLFELAVQPTYNELKWGAKTMRLATVALALALSACAGPNNYQWEDAAKVHAGMSEREVTAILGAPHERARDGNVAIWTWALNSASRGTRTVTFRMLNGKVVERTTPSQ